MLTPKEAMEIRTKEYKALEKLRAEEKKMTDAALKAKDKALADKLRHVPTSYRKALARLSPKDKENRPDGPTGNLCISKYTLGGVEEGEVWFPANGIPSKKHKKGRGMIFCRLADVTRFERMGFVHIGLVGPYNMDDLVDLGQDYKHSKKFLEMLQAGYIRTLLLSVMCIYFYIIMYAFSFFFFLFIKNNHRPLRRTPSRMLLGEATRYHQ